MNTVLYTAEQLPPVDRREVFRYARTSRPSETEEALLDSCIGEILPVLNCRIVWTELPAAVSENRVRMGNLETVSSSLAAHLKGCGKCILFAAAIGIGTDRLILKYSSLSPVRALFLESIGNERIEALCDTFCAEFGSTASRFSPGYGDLSLNLQRDIVRLLDTPRQIGLTLNESLLMTPSKSVTAVFGIKE